jgi:hypothetical protein
VQGNLLRLMNFVACMAFTTPEEQMHRLALQCSVLVE